VISFDFCSYKLTFISRTNQCPEILLSQVARELENPFHNVPNEVPLNNFHAQYNHALITMYSGYHPDAYWQMLPVESAVELDDLNGDTDHPPQNPAEHRASVISAPSSLTGSGNTFSKRDSDGGAMTTATANTALSSSVHSDNSSFQPAHSRHGSMGHLSVSYREKNFM
jgi:hypothetical protein